MSNLNSITICCDFLMTKNSTQHHHLKWFSILIKRALSNITDLNVVNFVSDEIELSNFQREIFFNKSNLLLDSSETHYHFNDNEIEKKSLEYLSKYLNNTFIIGYELSEETKKLLDILELQYIDVWLHPIRFLDDNFFAYHSNNQNIQNALIEKSLDEDIYYLYADKIKIQSLMGWDKFHNGIDKILKENSCLFVGQTLTDKAVCKNGKMLNVLDFKDKFEQLTREYSHVYFSRHPMLRGDDSEQLAYLSDFENVSIISEPAYKLLCSDKIKKVTAVSSSLVYESKFFNKETEFFYRPIVPVYNKTQTSPGNYCSIYNALHSSAFWKDILSYITTTKELYSTADYLSKKNTYRDMLSLYYNNKVFDKEHHTYEKMTSKKSISNPKPKIKVEQYYFSNKIAFSKITEEVKKFDIVSFDIFDTILERKTSRPSDAINFVAEYAKNKYEISKDIFTEARRQAKNFSKNNHETSLQERYDIIGLRLSIEKAITDDLMKKEIEYDIILLKPRRIGTQLLEFSKKRDKRVILTSDIFYDRETIISMLNNCGIKNYDKIYLSSEHDLTKESGTLYDLLLTNEKGKIIHIGDNKKSDYDMALSKKICATWLLSNHDQLRKTIRGYQEIGGDYSGVRNGLIQNNLSKYPMITSNPGYSGGKALDLGYNVVGDMFLAFANWIATQAKERKIKKVVFLARDGEIIKKVFDIISGDETESIYLLASRRCLRVASLFNEQDVKKEVESFILSLKNNQANIYKFISLRFGVDGEIIKNLDKEGLLSNFKDQPSIEKFLNNNEFIEKVLENATQERTYYLNYLNGLGIDSECAFVDIGHNGSLQASLAKLLNLQKSIGFYFATYSGINDAFNGIDGSHEGVGYYRDRLPVSTRSDLYIKYALMLESLFLNNKGTFINFTTNPDNELVPNYLSTKDERRRIIFINDLQKGIQAYVRDVNNTLSQMGIKIADSPSFSQSYDPCARFFDIMKDPTIRDAEVFSGVTIENFFSGRDIRYLTPPVNDLNAVSMWKEGTKLLRDKAEIIIASKPSLIERPSFKKKMAKISLRSTKRLLLIATPLIGKKKINKLKKNEERFFLDSNIILRKIWEASK